MAYGYLQTGQERCYDTAGREMDCNGSGQDGELRRGEPWPDPRFVVGGAEGELVQDNLTGLLWSRDASLAEFPLDWREANDFVQRMNMEAALGRSDWRLPDRRELRSLLSLQTRNPALPEGHPFRNVILSWYWTSSTAAASEAYAWYVHMEGARCFYGNKQQYYLLWPVCGEGNGILPATTEAQGGHGASWPAPRFQSQGEEVRDRLTGLRWRRAAGLSGEPQTWAQALAAAAELNHDGVEGGNSWRLPNINELESLVDLDRYGPALPQGHPFEQLQEGYWSSTTSAFEPDWAWALYLTKGAIGIGQKRGAHFGAWAVRDAA